jgi:recombination protein RecR
MGGVFSPSVENLVAQLSRLPGVGSRTAQRLAFHILQRPKDEALALAAALTEVKERVRFCRECGNLTEDEVCAICSDARRDHTVICVVEQPVDVVSLERTSTTCSAGRFRRSTASIPATYASTSCCSAFLPTASRRSCSRRTRT